MLKAIWEGIASLFEWIFSIIKPVGMMVDWVFIILIAIGSAYWLIYEQRVAGGGLRNYLADKVEEKKK